MRQQSADVSKICIYMSLKTVCAFDEAWMYRVSNGCYCVLVAANWKTKSKSFFQSSFDLVNFEACQLAMGCALDTAETTSTMFGVSLNAAYMLPPALWIQGEMCYMFQLMSSQASAVLRERLLMMLTAKRWMEDTKVAIQNNSITVYYLCFSL